MRILGTLKESLMRRYRIIWIWFLTLMSLLLLSEIQTYASSTEKLLDHVVAIVFVFIAISVFTVVRCFFRWRIPRVIYLGALIWVVIYLAPVFPYTLIALWVNVIHTVFFGLWFLWKVPSVVAALAASCLELFLFVGVVYLTT